MRFPNLLTREYAGGLLAGFGFGFITCAAVAESSLFWPLLPICSLLVLIGFAVRFRVRVAQISKPVDTGAASASGRKRIKTPTPKMWLASLVLIAAGIGWFAAVRYVPANPGILYWILSGTFLGAGVWNLHGAPLRGAIIGTIIQGITIAAIHLLPLAI